MPEPSAQQAFQRAVQHFQAGRLNEAVAACEEVLSQAPDHADAVELLGLARLQTRDAVGAEEMLRKATRLRPQEAAYHANLGSALAQLGRPAEAVEAFQAALNLRPGSVETRLNLARSLWVIGRLAEATAMAEQVATISQDPRAYVLLGEIHWDQEKAEPAIASFRRAIELKPDSFEAHNGLAIVLKARRRFAESAEACSRALQIRPQSHEALNNLANAYCGQEKLDEAIDLYRNVLQLRPENVEARVNLAAALKDTGQTREAVEHFRAAEAIRPDHRIAGERLCALHCLPEYDRSRLFDEHEQWYRQYALPLANQIRPHTNNADERRRPRVGYVSHHLGNNPVGRFILPLLSNHDAADFEVYFYCDRPRPDAITARLKACVHGWRVTLALSDERLAELVRADGIDVLVDLTMHATGNRLLAFARKPAPVQVSYLAYCGTTGLRTIDYRLTDSYCDPPEMGDQFAVEKTVRMSSYWCYPVPDEAPAVGPLPAASNGHVTFGCLNSYFKVTAETLSTWALIAHRVPGSIFLVHSKLGSHREKARDIFARAGVERERLAFVGTLPIDAYFGAYNRIDIALDPFPYCGGTTSCDALWMGVPVVSLVGETGVSRGGLSVLSTVGFPELTAGSVDQYVEAAAHLALDTPRLDELRRGLRARVQSSPLMDGRRFAREIEQAYRRMWQTWCRSQMG